MEDLATWILQWAFSAAGVAHLIVASLLAMAAARLSPNRSVAKFLFFASLVWLAASLVSMLETTHIRVLLAGALWVLSIVVVYAAVLGILVARGKGTRPIIVAATILLVVQIPLSWLSGLYFSCYVGHDCP